MAVHSSRSWPWPTWLRTSVPARITLVPLASDRHRKLSALRNEGPLCADLGGRRVLFSP